MQAGEDLGELIADGLRRSDWLIVLCSPASAASRYVRSEISQFKLLVMRLLNNSDSFIFAKGCLPGSLDLSQDLLSFSPPDVPLGFEVMPGEVLHDGID